MLFPYLTLFDFRTIFSNFIEPNKVDKRFSSQDYVILVPIFNKVSYLTNIDFLKEHPGKVVLCTTTLESKKFYKELNKIARESDFRVIKCKFDDRFKNPWKIYQKTLLAHDYVLGESIKSLNAKYVIFLDADTVSYENIDNLIGTMEKHDFDLSSTVVLPPRSKKIVQRLQYIEYTIAMKSRKIYPWLTSGAAMIAKREKMIQIMEKHSLFFNGGDIEIGKIAYLTGLKVGHIDATFYTDIPTTIPALFKQRISWFCGAFRHSIINAHTNLFSPMYAFYFTIVIFLLLPLKIHELFIHWYIFPFIYMFYLTAMFTVNWEIRSPHMFLFPIYSLAQVLLMPICGAYRYIKTVIKTKKFGFMKVHYKSQYHPLRYARNIGLLILMVVVMFNIHLVEGKLLLSNIDLFDLTGINLQATGILGVIYNGFKLTFILIGAFMFIYLSFRVAYAIKAERIREKKYLWRGV